MMSIWKVSVLLLSLAAVMGGMPTSARANPYAVSTHKVVNNADGSVDVCIRTVDEAGFTSEGVGIRDFGVISDAPFDPLTVTTQPPRELVPNYPGCACATGEPPFRRNCARRCTDAAECPSRVCAPAPGGDGGQCTCVSDVQCPSGEVCNGGVCVSSSREACRTELRQDCSGEAECQAFLGDFADLLRAAGCPAPTLELTSADCTGGCPAGFECDATSGNCIFRGSPDMQIFGVELPDPTPETPEHNGRAIPWPEIETPAVDCVGHLCGNRVQCTNSPTPRLCFANGVVQSFCARFAAAPKPRRVCFVLGDPIFLWPYIVDIPATVAPH